MEMLKRYEVILEVPALYSACYEVHMRTSFGTRESAWKHARKIASRHSVTTLYSASRFPRVCVSDLKGEYAEYVDPEIVPSVGELGYW
jgi:hypothetical protein